MNVGQRSRRLGPDERTTNDRQYVHWRVRLAACLLCLLIVTPLQADIRVLVTFDELGHRVHGVYRQPQADVSAVASSDADKRRLEIGEVLAQQAHARNEGEKLPSQPVNTAASVEVLWFDNLGQLIESRWINDPRYVHDPTIGVNNVTTVLLTSGPYLLEAPDSAVEGLVKFPAWQLPEVNVPALQQSLNLLN